MENETLSEQVARFLRYKDRGWSKSTRDNYRYALNSLLQFLEDKPLTRNTVEEFFSALKSKGKAESTRSQMETYVKSFITWLFDEELIEQNWGKKIKRTRVHRKPRTLPNILEMLDLIRQATVPHGHKQHRFSQKEHGDCLAFMLVAGGTRNHETRQILRSDVSLSSRQIVLSHAKGGNPSPIAIPDIPWLIENLETRVKGRTPEEVEILSDRTHYKASDMDRLFVVNEVKLEQTMRKAGKIGGYKLVVHDLRRIFANDLKNNGAASHDIMNAMRHQDFSTTLGYLEFNTADKQRTLRNHSTIARQYRTRDEKEKELLDKAHELGKLICSNREGKKIILEVEIN